MRVFTESRYKIITHNRRSIKSFLLFFGKKWRRKSLLEVNVGIEFAFGKEIHKIFLGMNYYFWPLFINTEKNWEDNLFHFFHGVFGQKYHWAKSVDGNLFNKRLVFCTINGCKIRQWRLMPHEFYMLTVDRGIMVK